MKPSQPSGRRTLTGLLWTFSASVAQLLLQLLVLAVLARLLVPEHFGLMGAGLVIIGLGSIVAQFGLGPAIVQRPELGADHVRTAFTLSIILGVGMAGLLWLSAPFLAFILRMEELTTVLRALAFAYPLVGLSVVAESLLQREFRFGGLVTVQAASHALGYGLVAIVLALSGMGVWALVFGHLSQLGIRSLAFLVWRRHTWLPLLKKQPAKDLLSFGAGTTAADIASHFANEGDSLVVARWLGAPTLGIYGRARQLVVVPEMTSGRALDKVLFPTLASIQNDLSQLSIVYRRGITSLALLTLPPSVAMIILAPELILLVLGPAWEGVVLPFQILMLGALLRASYRFSSTLAKSVGAVYSRARRQWIYAGVLVVTTWFGHHWGLPGVAGGVLIAITVNFFLMSQLSLRLTGLAPRAFAEAYIPAIRLALLWGALTLGFVFITQRFGLAEPISLLGSAVVLLAGTLLAWRLWPRQFLGADGYWLLGAVTGAFPSLITGRLRALVRPI